MLVARHKSRQTHGTSTYFRGFRVGLGREYLGGDTFHPMRSVTARFSTSTAGAVRNHVFPGATAHKSVTVDQDMIQRFADLSGDHNPIHLDAEFAAQTRFGRPIAHGMLAVSTIVCATSGTF